MSPSSPSSDARGSVSILDAMTDAKLFGAHFAAPSWDPWRTALRVLFGLPLEEDELKRYRECTGREELPTESAREAWFVVGRRGGKSIIAALVAVFLACFRTYRLAPGERATVMVIAADRRQARVVFRYLRALLDAPLLRSLVARETAESIDLTNGVTLEVHTASFRRIRGYSVAAAILDEVSFWPTEDSAEPDHEVVNALRPAMATIPGSLLLGISSPYARRGVLFDAFAKHYGQAGDVLVWKAPSRTMNATIPEDVVERAFTEDPEAASAEWGAEFRRDVEAFVSREAVQACVVSGRLELGPLPGFDRWAFCDPSGGSSDSMTLAIAHREQDLAILDCVREVRPPFSPESVVREFGDVLKRYALHQVQGDRYGGLWISEQFKRHGIYYRPAEKTKSDIYRELLPMLNSGQVELLDHPRLVAQLLGLERRTSRGGRDSIDHAPRAHDDVANAAAGALNLCRKPSHVVRGIQW